VPVIARPPAAIPEADDVTEEIPVITAPKNLRTATTPTSLTKAVPAAPPARPTVSRLATRRPPATESVPAPPVSAPGSGERATAGIRQPVTAPATRGPADVAQITTARPADADRVRELAAATEWAELPKQRKRRRSRRFGAAEQHVPEHAMLRPLFVEENTFEEVLANVRAESAGITPRSGMWPAAIVIAVAVLMLIILAAGVLLAFAA
jgi:hypothetical protein